LRACEPQCNTNPALGNYNFRAPAAVFRRTVMSMLPKKTLSALAALNRLKCFEGIPAPYDKMKRKVVPDALRVIRLRPGRKSTNLGEMYSGLGWKHQALLKTLEAKRKVKSAAYYEKVKAARALRAKAAAEVSIPADAKAVLEKFGF
jgi:large subunit ribosomal protein L13Ae